MVGGMRLDSFGSGCVTGWYFFKYSSIPVRQTALKYTGNRQQNSFFAES
jgi:hypothetical protein